MQQTQADHSSILEDAMRPPMPTGEIHSHTGGIIPAGDLLPDDWEKDLLEGIGEPAPGVGTPIPADPFIVHPVPVHSPPATPIQAPPIAPDPFAADPFAVEPPGESTAAPIPMAGIDAPPVHVSPIQVPPIHAVPVEASPLPEDPFAEAPIQPRPAPVLEAPAANPIVSADSIGLLSAFLQGVGLPDAKPADPAATLQHLGEAFRSLVAGLRAVLIARASIKSEFRIEQTMIRARGNNPLKFSADDDDAISALLGVGRRVDMTPAAAVADALHDIRLHELASMAAMQAAVRAVLDGLHPDKVRASAEQGGGLNVLPGQRKARAWDVYEALHGRTVQALSDDFDSVFGKAFARAYEEALDDLSAKEKK
ncbi:MAG TPA: type VI secretion system-associated FHA domain protein TagH [Rhodopila sp.]